MSKKIFKNPAFITGIILVIAQFVGKWYADLMVYDLYYKSDPGSLIYTMDFFDSYIILYTGIALMIITVIFEYKKAGEANDKNIINQINKINLSNEKGELNLSQSSLKEIDPINEINLSKEKGELDLSKSSPKEETKLSDTKKDKKSNKGFKIFLILCTVIFALTAFTMFNNYRHSISYYYNAGVPTENGLIQTDKEDFIALVNINLETLENEFLGTKVPSLKDFRRDEIKESGESYYYTEIEYKKGVPVTFSFTLNENDKIKAISILYDIRAIKADNVDEFLDEMERKRMALFGYLFTSYVSISGFNENLVEDRDNMLDKLTSIKTDEKGYGDVTYQVLNGDVTLSYTKDDFCMITITNIR